MKSYINKQLVKLEGKIIKKFRTLNKRDFSIKYLINYLIYLNLFTEKLLLKKNYNPEPEIIKEIKYLLMMLDRLESLKEFSKKNYNIQKFEMEKNHQILFQKLWTNYSFKQFKKERLERYEKRIKINKLQSFIRNKTVVDFGCGHGNFLMSMTKFKLKKGVGIDYGKKTIEYAKKYKNKYLRNQKLTFLQRTVYNTKLKSNYFDLSIQNGVFHHLKYEDKAYKECSRVLKKGGFLWLYTDGGGGLRDYITDLTQDLLKNVKNEFLQNQIKFFNLSINKTYHLGDNMSAKYKHYDLPAIKKKLKKFGFKFVRQLKGGFKTDFDFPYYKDKFFKKKFGSGDLRLLFVKE